MRTESFVVGEELTSGKTVEETVYDDKGREVKKFTYNTLDSSSKFYTENEYDENGKTTAEIDETGENKTKFEFVDGTSIVRSKTLPNGSKFSYGHDENDTVVAITQSTEEGEENSTQVAYTCGEITEVRSGNNVVRYTYDGKRRKTAVDLNDTRYVEYTYDDKIEEGGETVNKVTATLVGGDTAESVSDLRGNVLETKYNGKTLTSAVYDAKGKRTHLLDGVTGVETATEYDELDRVKTVTVGNVTETTEYNGYGNLASKTRTENGEETQQYTYEYKENAAKDLESVSVGDVIVSLLSDCLGRSTGKGLSYDGKKIAEETITYRKVGDHATNMPSTIRFGNRIAAPVTPLSRAQSANATSEASTEAQTDASSVTPLSQAQSAPATSEASIVAEGSQPQSQFVRLDNLKYTYDACGNITEVRENGLLAVKYTYDALNRLIREDNKQLGKTWLYSYDNNGNILSKREFDFTLKDKTLLEELDGNETLYAYDRDRLLLCGDKEFEYDDLGNPKVYLGKECDWANGRQLTKFDTTTFTYDGQGRRIEKNITQFTYDSAGNLIRQTDGTNTLSFIYDNNGVVGVEYDNSTYFYRKNAQGDIIAILDSKGNVVVKYTYDAWGNHAIKVLDSTYTALSQLNPFRYRGYYYDTDTDLYYLKTRYYDPEVGRFITIDDLQYLDPEHINGLNLYAYCGNNPVMNVDPTGTFLWAIFLGAMLLGGVFGAVSGGMAARQQGQTWWKGALIGGLTGAVAGAAFGLGGALGAAAFAAGTTVAVGTALGTLTGVAVGSFLAGVGIYKLETLLYGQEFCWDMALMSGGILALESCLNFGMGLLLGNQGFFPDNNNIAKGFWNKLFGKIKFAFTNHTNLERYFLKATILTPAIYMINKIWSYVKWKRQTN